MTVLKYKERKDKSRPTVRGDKIVVASWTIFRRDENDMAKALLLIGRPTLHWCVYIQAGRTSRCISEQRFRTRVTTDDTLTTMELQTEQSFAPLAMQWSSGSPVYRRRRNAAATAHKDTKPGAGAVVSDRSGCMTRRRPVPAAEPSERHIRQAPEASNIAP